MKSGVYRHYADGRFYQVLFAAKFLGTHVDKDADIRVFSQTTGTGGPGLFAEDASVKGEQMVYRGKIELFTARAHGRLNEGDKVVVYCPLYSDKPGRRISVRLLSEFNEQIPKPCKVGFADGCTTDPAKGHYFSRFEYVGDVVPQ